MGNYTQRTTNGQKAAMFGLILAGVAFEDACLIVGVAGSRMKRHYMPADWMRSPLPVPYRAMTEKQRYHYNILREVMPRTEACRQATR